MLSVLRLWFCCYDALFIVSLEHLWGLFGACFVAQYLVSFFLALQYSG